MTCSLPASSINASGAGAPAFQERLAAQLHTLTQVVETITYRLLELEERLGEQEMLLQEMQQQAGAAVQFSEQAEQRVDDTEERLGQLESLLSGQASIPPAAARHLQPVRAGQRPQPEQEQPVPIDGPFLEEPEQPFMDDLAASDPRLNPADLEDLTA